MDWRIIIAICVAFFVDKNVSFEFEGCSLPEAGYAWEYNSTMDIMLADVNSSEICGDLCLKNETCQGYSWEKGGIVSGYCVHYSKLRSNLTCKSCISNKIPGQLPKPLACSGSSGNILGFSEATNEQQCWEKCAGTDGCNFYSWFDSDGLFQNTCFLYKECNSTKEILNSVSRSCNMPPVPQCKNHKILREHWRNVNYYDYSRCNNGGKAGWYRFKNEAGNKMPDYPPGQHYCNSHQPGWVNGTHPSRFGETKDIQICFRTNDGPCGNQELGAAVTNCGQYFVYWLNFEDPCNGYCGEN